MDDTSSTGDSASTADSASSAVSAARKRRWPWVTGGVVVLAAIAVGIAALLGAFSPAQPQVAAKKPQPASEAPAKTVEKPDPPKVVIATTEQVPYAEVWSPPDSGENFWQVVDPDNGYPEDGGTDYLLAHACEKKDCKGDEIRKLQVGDGFEYRGQDYVVDEKYEIGKAEIGDQPIWEHVPDKVVIITCILNEETMTFYENDIVVGSPKS